MISTGALDELPEGPNGFGVFDDGSLAITDPLRKRIAVFDATGKFRHGWKISFAADSVTVEGNGMVQVREASTGDFHTFDEKGNPLQVAQVGAPEPAEAHVLTEQSGMVTRPGVVGGGSPLEVRLDRPGLRLLSLEALATDGDGNTFVALETTAGGEAVDVNKYVRKYNADGVPVSEIADISLDYYVRPVNELRVRKGTVYQLMTSRSEVRINVWDTN